ncbi:MAG: DNA repair protein RecO [Firmicutes bacterium]|nr:DNA repair protein RecO [Bacillota bacterium]
MKSSEHGEFDKMLTLFTHEGEVVRAKIRGVKKERAKLKFASLPFALCEFELNSKNGFLSVVGATQIEDISSIVHDYDAFILAAVMFEVTTVAVSHSPIPELFPLILKCFRNIIFKDTCPFSVAKFYINKILITEGYKKNDNKTLETLEKESQNELQKTITLFETSYDIRLKTKTNL